MLPCSSFRTVVSRNLLNLLNLIHGTTLLIKESFSPLQLKTMSSKKSTQNMSPFCPLCLIYKLIFKSPQVSVGEVGCHSGPRCCSLDLDLMFTIEGEITEFKHFVKEA